MFQNSCVITSGTPDGGSFPASSRCQDSASSNYELNKHEVEHEEDVAMGSSETRKLLAAESPDDPRQTEESRGSACSWQAARSSHAIERLPRSCIAEVTIWLLPSNKSSKTPNRLVVLKLSRYSACGAVCGWPSKPRLEVGGRSFRNIEELEALMSSGWKAVYRDGPHFFEGGHSLCGLFSLKKSFLPEPEPKYEDACSKCWQLSRPPRENSVDARPEMAIAC